MAAFKRALGVGLLLALAACVRFPEDVCSEDAHCDSGFWCSPETGRCERLPDEEAHEPPRVVLTEAPPPLTNQASARFVFHCAGDAACRYQCRLNAAPWGTCTPPVLHEGLDEGPQHFIVRAIDDHDEVSDELEHTWTIDRVPPVVTLTGPPSPTRQTSARIDLDCDKASCTYVDCGLDGEDVSPCTDRVDLADLADGDYVFTAAAVDLAGNRSDPASHAWRVDTVEPVVTLLDAPPSPSLDTEATFTFGCDKEDCTFECRLDGDPYDACDPPVVYQDLSAGSHEFRVRATDPAGNRSAEVLHVWTVEIPPPDVILIEAPQDPTVDTAAHFAFECSAGEDACTFECSLGGQSWTACTSPAEYGPLAPGFFHTFNVRARAGGGAGAPATWRWQIVRRYAAAALGAYNANHQCLLEAAGALWCWGSNFYGQVGVGPDAGNSVSAPTRVPHPEGTPGPTWTSVSTGDSHTCAIDSQGALWCWGSNFYGQLGVDTGEADRAHDPIGVPHPDEGTDAPAWTSVAAGGHHTCALDDDGALWCWGRNDFDQTGIDSGGAAVLSPTGFDPAGTGESWRRVVAEERHTCAVGSDDALWCWGSNGSCRLGSSGGGTSARRVGGDAFRVSEVSVGREHGCAIEAGGALWCWGANAYGQVGQEATSSVCSPIQVDTAAWAHIALGQHHACGEQDDGALLCWGRNDRGQLGDGSDVTARHEPGPVTIEGPWTELIAGMDRACALREDESLWCWGRVDSTTTHPVPAVIP